MKASPALSSALLSSLDPGPKASIVGTSSLSSPNFLFFVLFRPELRFDELASMSLDFFLVSYLFKFGHGVLSRSSTLILGCSPNILEASIKALTFSTVPLYMKLRAASTVSALTSAKVTKNSCSKVPADPKEESNLCRCGEWEPKRSRWQWNLCPPSAKMVTSQYLSASGELAKLRKLWIAGWEGKKTAPLKSSARSILQFKISPPWRSGEMCGAFVSSLLA